MDSLRYWVLEMHVDGFRCQDNETSWSDWALDAEREAMLRFTQKAVRIRAEHPSLGRAGFFKGRKIRGADIRDIMWLRHDGQLMSEEDWNTSYTRALGMLMAGNGIDEVDEEGKPITDDDLLLLINGGHEPLDFVMPNIEQQAADWELLLDTNDDDATESVSRDGRTRLESRSLRLFRRPASGDGTPPSTAM